MQRLGEEVHLHEDEARGGSTPHIVRYVLLTSLLLAVLAMSAIWISRALIEDGPRAQSIPADQHALGG